MERLQDTLQLRDILIMQDALDQHSAPVTESDDPLDQPGRALCLAYYFNQSVPERFRLGETEMYIRIRKSMVTPKRKLLKDLYRAWRGYGRPVRRGFTFPPLRFAKTMLETMPELVELGLKASSGECPPNEYQERFLELFSRVHGSFASR